MNFFQKTMAAFSRINILSPKGKRSLQEPSAIGAYRKEKKYEITNCIRLHQQG